MEQKITEKQKEINLVNRILNHYKNWKFKNTVLLIIGLLLFFYFLDSNFVKNLISWLGDLKYIGAFIVGIFFVSIFTVAPSIAILFYLADKLPIWEISLLAGLGAVLGDYLIFKFLKNKVFEEIRPLFSRLIGDRILDLFKTPYFAWTSAVIGAIIIASPLPDEAGLGLLGLSNIKVWKFLLLSFVLNTVGIALILLFVKGV